MASGGVFRNRNVVLTMAFNFLDGACFSVWSAQLLPVLVNSLGGDKAVGWCAAALGVAQIVGATIAGYTADKLPRKVVIRIGAFSGLVAVPSTIVTVQLLVMPSFYISQALWGIYLGMVSTSSEALFADSVASGHRAFIYNLKWIIQIVCYCVGYLVALIMLLVMGNVWSTKSLQIVMTVGLAAHPIAQLLLLLLKDENALRVGDSDLQAAAAIKNSNTIPQKKVLQSTLTTTLIGEEETIVTYAENKTSIQVNAKDEENLSLGLQNNSKEYREDHINQTNVCETDTYLYFNSPDSHDYRAIVSWICSPNAVPYMVCFTDFWMAVGSAMTVQYITLFLVHDYKITPTLLMGAYIIISCSAALCAAIVRYVGEHYIGRLPAVIAVRIVGTTFLLLLAIARGPMAKFALVVTFFIIRNATMNSTMGITRSVIMDCVRKESRAKWSAFESFSSFTWAGSAVIGGYIADAKGYQFTFFITAIIHYAGILVLIPAAVAMHGAETRLRAVKRAQREAQRNTGFS
ncbi:putative MFS transporter [Trypanosoma theileri]|uniref:Putative MFS transporter n=1 Tax=Trypanosoma theileri TaxID=67003 RepID=A0A1X0NU64_9TRYP|nr:putative MFS transporter [Trypanosoma theileri]ORC88151.1 putative MFS transporter [Trypanosoma theileri]